LSFYFSNPVKFQYSLSVDDFSEIIAGIRAIVIGLGGLATPPCGVGIFDGIDGIDGVDKVDCVDRGQD
jgi:hypothetical protein